MLSDYIGDRKEGFLLHTRSGNMLSPESFFRNGLATIFKRMGRTRVRFNAFRRFRESVLLRSECCQILIDYWMGHENPDMSARYGRPLIEDVKYRKGVGSESRTRLRPSAGRAALGRELRYMRYKFRGARSRSKCVNHLMSGRGERI
jgi:hypothetical protein